MKKIIFITSSGRSGSTALANTLNTIKGVKAFQSPFGQENYSCSIYLKDIKKVNKDRDELIKSVHNDGYHYIESSVCIRHHIKSVVNNYPKCLIIHLVRDGRDFVRSGFNRTWFKKSKKRFIRICKHWSDAQCQIIESMKELPTENKGGIVRLEDLSKNDINWFLNNIGLDSEDRIKMIKTNVTKTQFKLPIWKDWNSQLMNDVKKYMGKELEYFKYK